MKYNLIKKMGKAKKLTFILRGVDLIDANIELMMLHLNEKGRMFADVSSIMRYIHKPDCRLFEVKINGETITYEIEQDQFQKLDELFRPKTQAELFLEKVSLN